MLIRNFVRIRWKRVRKQLKKRQNAFFLKHKTCFKRWEQEYIIKTKCCSHLSSELSTGCVRWVGVCQLVPGRHNQPTTVSLNPDLVRRILAHVKRCLRPVSNSRKIFFSREYFLTRERWWTLIRIEPSKCSTSHTETMLTINTQQPLLWEHTFFSANVGKSAISI